MKLKLFVEKMMSYVWYSILISLLLLLFPFTLLSLKWGKIRGVIFLLGEILFEPIYIIRDIIFIPVVLRRHDYQGKPFLGKVASLIFNIFVTQPVMRMLSCLNGYKDPVTHMMDIQSVWQKFRMDGYSRLYSLKKVVQYSCI